MVASDTRQGRGFLRWKRSLNTTRLKRIAVGTYFGIYALLVFGIHRTVNGVLEAVPAAVRPAPIEPVWVVMDLPRSVAMGMFSLGVTALVVGVLVLRSVLTTPGGHEPPTQDGTASRGTGDGGTEAGSRETGTVGTGPGSREQAAVGARGASDVGDEPFEPGADRWTASSGRPAAGYWAQDNTSIRDGGAGSLEDGRNNVHGVESGGSPESGSGERVRSDEDPWPEGWVSGDELSASSQE